jgi:hypothetical protein
VRPRALWVAVIALLGCSKAPPEPPKPKPTAFAEDGGSTLPVLVAPTAAPPPSLADGGAAEMRSDLGWDLDPEDPARDYVRRYIRATSRYADKTDCVLIGKSADRGGKRAVEVRETPGCGGANTVRDVFYVDVGGDRLTVDDPATRAPLKAWPDASRPDQAAAPVTSINSIREWRTPVSELLEKWQLSPVTVQLYGRGTYVVVTLTGWRKPLAHEASNDELRAAGQKLCAANQGKNLALKEAMVEGVWLRYKCPDGTFRWDTRWSKK